MIYHVTHQRLVFPELGIASDKKVVAHALPKVELGLGAMEPELSHGQNFVLGAELTLADFFILPSTFAFSLTEEGRKLYPKFAAFSRWRERMENLPTTKKLRSAARTNPSRARMGELTSAEILKRHVHDSRSRTRFRNLMIQ